MSFIALAFICVLCQAEQAQAQTQWTTAPNTVDIYKTTGGNVGIGTSTPVSQLEISSQSPLLTLTHGNGPYDNAEFIYRVGGNWKWGMIHYADGNVTPALQNSLVFYQFTDKNNAAVNQMRMMIDNSGNVGIGTFTPRGLLEVSGAEKFIIVGQSGSFGSGAVLSGTAGTSFLSNNAYLNSAASLFKAVDTSKTSAGLQFSGRDVYVRSFSAATNPAPTELMFINGTSGNVGLGTLTPTTRLDVTGQIRSSSGGFVFPDGTVQTTAAAGGGGTITGVTAGAGLTGGGTTGTTTLNVGVGTGLSLAPDSISVNYGSTAGTAVEGDTSITVSPGTGMSGGGPITLGAGGSLTLTNADRGSSQNIFKNIANAAGTTQFSAASNNDAVRFEGSGGTSISFDAATKKVIINSSTSGSTLPAANVSAGQFGQNTGGGDFSFPANLTVAGNIAAKFQDVAEWVPSSRAIPVASVVVLDASKSNHVLPSAQAYDTRVAGVISAQPGLLLGEAGEGKVLVATTGRVKVKVDATRAPIRIGDLLVTSEKEGVAMRSEPLELGGASLHRPGTLIGKALEPLEKGTGEILVLLSLQ
ncbi:MAG TPA: hypothetical protein VF528_20185 [Pyrinomonadaceae bacterium]